MNGYLQVLTRISDSPPKTKTLSSVLFERSRGNGND